jgi:hypothetical protein
VHTFHARGTLEMQKATIAVTVPHFFATHFAFSDEGLPYHISYLTFQGSRNVPDTIIGFPDFQSLLLYEFIENNNVFVIS